MATSNLATNHQTANLPEGSFDFNCPSLKWNKTYFYGPCKTTDIPIDRLEDFILGEEERGQTKFVRHLKGQGKGAISRTLYDCSFGPEDYTSNISPFPIKPGAKRRRLKVERGESQKRGCQAHFVATVYRKNREQVNLRYYQEQHVNKLGCTCHGEACASAGIHRTQPHLSEDARSFIETSCFLGLPTKDIIQQVRLHVEADVQAAQGFTSLAETRAFLKTKGNVVPRDYYVAPYDVKNIMAGFDAKLRRDRDQVESLRRLVKERSECILFYKENGQASPLLGVEDFQICFADPRFVPLLVKYGNHRVGLMDSTCGTNNLKSPLYTLMVLDEHNHEVPVAWSLGNNGKEEGVKMFLQSVVTAAQELEPSFRFAAMLIDDNDAEQGAILETMPDTAIHLCDWHVRMAWVRQEGQKVKGKEERKELSKSLEALMRYNVADPGKYTDEQLRAMGKQQLEAFYRKHKDLTAFVQSFKGHWEGKMERWMHLFRNKPYMCNQNTTEAIESYHSVLKDQFLNTEKGRLIGRRLDWLIEKLLDEVSEDYLHRLQRQAAGFVVDRKLERDLKESVTKASYLEPQLIKLPQQPGQAAEVQGGTEVYTIKGAGTAHVTCTCAHFARANLCKHAIAVNMRMDPRLRYGLFLKHMPQYPSTEEGWRAMYEAAASAPAFAPTAPQRGGPASASAPMPVCGPSSGSLQPPLGPSGSSTQPPAREQPTPRMPPLVQMQSWLALFPLMPLPRLQAASHQLVAAAVSSARAGRTLITGAPIGALPPSTGLAALVMPGVVPTATDPLLAPQPSRTVAHGAAPCATQARPQAQPPEERTPCVAKSPRPQSAKRLRHH